MEFKLELNNRGLTDDELLDDLRRVVHKIAPELITKERYNEHGRVSSAWMRKRFGTWNHALQKAGIEVTHFINLTAEECVEDLKRVALTLGRETLTRADYRSVGKFSERPFIRHFGSWGRALAAAGLHLSESGVRCDSDEDYFKGIEEAWRLLGRQPKRDEVRSPRSRVSGVSISRRFGSWRSALEEFVMFMNQTAPPLPIEGQSNSATAAPLMPRISNRSPRTVPWRLRFLVMRRDAFRCCICGASPAMIPGTVLVIDHVDAWSNGGETTFENLQTLCEKCNGGKSNLAMIGP